MNPSKSKKKKKTKKNIYLNDDNLNDSGTNEKKSKIVKKKKKSKTEPKYAENESQNTESFSDPDKIIVTNKKKLKKKKIKKEKLEEEDESFLHKKKKINNITKIDSDGNDLEEDQLKIKPKKRKKRKISDFEDENINNLTEINNNENTLDKKEITIKSKKRKKRKKIQKRQVSTDSDENEKNNNLTEIQNENNFSEKDEDEEEDEKNIEVQKNKKRKKKNLLELDKKKKSKTPRSKLSKNKINNYISNKIKNNIETNEKSSKSSSNENIDAINKKKKKINKEEISNNKIKNNAIIKKSKDKRQIYLKNIGKMINLNNLEQINITKSIILNLFSTKSLRKIETDYEEENLINKNSLKIKEKNEDENEYVKNTFADFLIQINNSVYKGYKYSIKKSDYFVRNSNDKPIYTILNSEDAAIKKCEEIMESLDEGENWTDPDFGPQNNDNGRGNKRSLLGQRGSTEDTHINPDNIEWYRIKEINEDATFFYDGTESNDVMQGNLNDCWFISALSIIATKDYLLRGEFNKNILDDGKIDEEEIKMMSEGIYPPIFHAFSKSGIYCFRFFKNLKWRYVLVDDRLPCIAIANPIQPKSLIFAHCRQNNEFWVPLIEKAYAKLHGSYFDLSDGWIDDGLVDMTGLVSKKILKEETLKYDTKKIDEFWNLLLEYSSLKFDQDLYTKEGKKVTSKYYTRNKSMIGCSVSCNGQNREKEVIIKGNKVGIIVGHAYSILDVFEIPKPRKKSRKTSRLLRLRNPWGYCEWNGKWCDNSYEVIKNKEYIERELKKKYADTNEKIDFSKDDGTFLMRYSDFRKIFNRFYFCQNFPPNYIGIRFYDEWTKENSGGLPINNTQQEYDDFLINPQYYLEIQNSGKVIINLLQNDGRLLGLRPNEYNKKVCIILFKTKNDNPKKDFEGEVDHTLITQRRDLNFEINLKKGSYIVIPSLLKKGDCAPFNLEFYFKDELLPHNIDEEFDCSLLKYTIIKRLGKSVKCELINEYIASEMKMASKNKLEFILSAFQHSLKNQNIIEKTKGNNFM